MNVSILLLVATIGQPDPPKVAQPDPPRVVFLPMAPPTLIQRVFQPSTYTAPQTCSGPNCPQTQPQAQQWQPFGGLFRRR